MRFRVGVVLCLFTIYVGIGCRQALTPNIDRNKPPETWITAAPFDTITLVKGEDPEIGKIPIRFHLYWAGSDDDGAVTGFFWAVTETIPHPVPPFPGIPSLPGPKPQDYHFTTRTDSIFIFNVAEDIPDRQHAFFIYAVDNLGKPDPTPARFIFIAQDRFPPVPIIETCRCIGTVYALRPGGGVDASTDTVYVTDRADRTTVPRDTCPASSSVFVKWHGECQVPGCTITGFRYKLDEPRFVEVPPTVTTAAYNTGIPPDNIPLTSGTKIFVVRAVDQAFGTRDSTRRFQLNFSPITWWSGPDRSNPVWTVKENGERYVPLNFGSLPGPITGSLMGPDSVQILPALRREQRTFLEIWGDTIYARAEFDTVHMNSWVVLHNGGFDRDSRYLVKVAPEAHLIPGFPGGPVLEPGPPNGSAIGFRTLLAVDPTPPTLFGSIVNFAFTGHYPLFDPNDTREKKVIASYNPMFLSGKAYMTAKAEDGDGARDDRITDQVPLANRVDGGGGTPSEVALRRGILVFYVNRAPYFLTESPVFRPRAGMVDTFTTRVWNLDLPANDIDPYVTNTAYGGPSRETTLRRRITIHGLKSNGVDSLHYTDRRTYLNQQQITFEIPSTEDLKPGRVNVELELCDCTTCDPGQGRCISIIIPVEFQPPAPAEAALPAHGRPGRN